ncbi:glycosyltransferase family 2 protein [Vibrio owensii]|uniref:glycosyltransferase family 2 protein n=1 Tax=Vibrio owensii TaxID=696485 RepID=UPI0018F1410D|nr:glycosyltransferase family 2 protein [Vibrio owensii]
MLVTVGIPFYNASEFLSDSIKCILNQTYNNIEILLIDDGSTDDSLEIANSFSDDRIKVISDGENKKLPARLNQIIDIASGDYIMRMDADDLCSINRVEVLLDKLLASDSYDVVFSKVCSITNDCHIKGYHGKERYTPPSLSEITKGQTGFIHASLMAKKSWYERNRYNELSLLSEDYELYLNSVLKNDFNVQVIPDVLYFYREEGNATYSKMTKAYTSQIEILKRHLNVKNFSDIYFRIIQFQIKKIVISILNVMGLMSFIIGRRGNSDASISDDKVLEELNYIRMVVNNDS